MASQMLTQKGAEELSVQALNFLAQNPEMLSGFLMATGLDPSTLREAMKEDHFFREVMQYVLSDDKILIAFAEHVQFPPQVIANAAQLLGCHFE